MLPEHLALVCPACGEEVCVVTPGQLAAMAELPEHECTRWDPARLVLPKPHMTGWGRFWARLETMMKAAA